MKITVITVCYNAVEALEETIQSVLTQTYSDIEYVIIDGGSTDGTTNIIKKYEDRIAYWVSESDKGVYDAMNKGIGVTKGDWVNFMNAGDVFVNNKVIANVVGEIIGAPKCDVIYGDVILLKNRIIKMKRSADLRTIEKTLPFCHQSAFVRSQLLKEYLFDVKYRIAADYDFFYKLYLEIGIHFYKVDFPIAIYEASQGLSSKQRLTAYREICSINKRNKGFVNRIRYSIVLLVLYLKKVMSDLWK